MLTGLVATPLVLYAGQEFASLVFLCTVVFIVCVELLHRYWGLTVPFWSGQLATTRREHETFSWASISFLLTLFLLLWLTPLPVALAGSAMLAFGDGFSALAGRAFGRHKIPYNRRKSWEGSAAGFVMGLLGALMLMLWYASETQHAYAWTTLLLVGLVGSFFAMVGESLPNMQDNVVVPVFAAVSMTAVWMLLHLEPLLGYLPQKWIGT